MLATRKYSGGLGSISDARTGSPLCTGIQQGCARQTNHKSFDSTLVFSEKLLNSKARSFLNLLAK